MLIIQKIYFIISNIILEYLNLSIAIFIFLIFGFIISVRLPAGINNLQIAIKPVCILETYPSFPESIIWDMGLKVHYQIDSQTKALDILRDNLQPGIRLSTGTEPPNNPDFQILINGTPDKEHLSASPQLHSLVIPYAGFPESTRKLLLDFPHLKVYNLHHNAAPTAEMAIALLLAAAKFLLPIDRRFRDNNWAPRYETNPALLLEGKTVLILGFGHIGQRVGLVCQALGMQVVGVRRRVDSDLLPGLETETHPVQQLDQLLPRVHVLVITLPITAQTEGLVGARQLSLMQPGGLLVNVGRGRVVDQAALYQALTDGTLSAAGIDVWYSYPDSKEERSTTPPADYPFHELDNIVMSPHRGGGSLDTEKLRMQHLAELLNALYDGEPTSNLVDITAGY
jgi:phosphoglycerate dehydrogenase-like enzyme